MSVEPNTCVSGCGGLSVDVQVVGILTQKFRKGFMKIDVHWLIDWLVDQLIDCFFLMILMLEWLIDQLVKWPFGEMITGGLSVSKQLSKLLLKLFLI